jgi:non-ribosomal peptide synthetase component F
MYFPLKRTMVEPPMAERADVDFPCLTRAQRQQLLVDWNATAVDYPRDQCVHELFEEQAARNPLAVAAMIHWEI